MDVDPRTNVVVFQLNNPEVPHPVGEAPTQADDGIQQAWEAAARDDRATPETVAALHTEWEPTPTDTIFIKATFPNAEVAYNFTRPTDEGWEEALAAAGKALQEAAAREPKPDAKGPQDSARSRDAAADSHAGEAEPQVSDGPVRAAGTAESAVADTEPQLAGEPRHEAEPATSEAGEAGPRDGDRLRRGAPATDREAGSAEPPTIGGPENPAGAAGSDAAEAELRDGDEPRREAQAADSDAGEAGPQGGEGPGQAAGTAESAVADTEPRPAGESGHEAVAADADAGQAGPPTTPGPEHAAGIPGSDAAEPELRDDDGPGREAQAGHSDAGEAGPQGGEGPEQAAGMPGSDAAVAEPRDSDRSGPEVQATDSEARAASSDVGREAPPAVHGPAHAAGAASSDAGEAEPQVGGGSGLGVAGLAGGEDGPLVTGELVPMLWSESSAVGGGVVGVPHWPVVVGRLHLGLAVVIHTRRGTDSVYPVGYEQVGEHSFDVVMAEACEVLAGGMVVDVQETGGGRLFSLSGTLVAAAVCLPAFHTRLVGMVGGDRLVVGVPGQDEVYVAAAGGPLAGVVERLVHESTHPDTELVPTVLQVTAAGVEFVSERAGTQP